MRIPQVSFALTPIAMLSYNHSLPFGKAYTPIYPTFYIISSHVDALWHTFGYGGLRCLSESRGGVGGRGEGLMRQNLCATLSSIASLYESIQP